MGVTIMWESLGPCLVLSFAIFAVAESNFNEYEIQPSIGTTDYWLELFQPIKRTPTEKQQPQPQRRSAQAAIIDEYGRVMKRSASNDISEYGRVIKKSESDPIFELGRVIKRPDLTNSQILREFGRVIKRSHNQQIKSVKILPKTGDSAELNLPGSWRIM